MSSKIIYDTDTTATLPDTVVVEGYASIGTRVYENVPDVNGGTHAFSQALTSGQQLTVSLGPYGNGINGAIDDATRQKIMTMYNAGNGVTLIYDGTNTCSFNGQPDFDPVYGYGLDDSTGDYYTMSIPLITVE